MFSFFKILNYQKNKFGQLLFESPFNFSGETSLSDTVIDLIQGSQGAMFKFVDEHQFLPQETFNELIVKNVFLIGDAISKGHKLYVDKDFNVLSNPTIRLVDKDSYFHNDNLLLIDNNNFLKYEEQLSKFIVFAFNIDPFVRLDNSDINNNLFCSEIFDINISIMNLFSTSFYSSFSIMLNLPKSTHMMADFLNSDDFSNFSINRHYLSDYLFNLNKSINIKLISNYNTDDNFKILSVDVNQYDHGIPSHYINNENKNLKNETIVSTTYNIFSDSLKSLDSFLENYPTDYLHSLQKQQKEVLFQRFSNSVEKFNSSNNFTPTNIPYSSDNYYDFLFSCSQIYLTLMSPSFEHLSDEYDKFILNALKNPVDIIKALYMNKHQIYLFNSDIEKIIKQNLFNYFDQNINENNSYYSALSYLTNDFKSSSYFIQLLRERKDLINSDLENNFDNHYISVPLLDLFKQKEVINTYFLELLSHLESSKLSINNNVIGVSKNNKYLYFKLSDDINFNKIEPMFSDIKQAILDAEHYSIEDNIKQITQTFREITLLYSLPDKDNSTPYRKAKI